MAATETTGTKTRTAMEQAVELIREEPRSPSQLVELLGVSRTAVAKIQRELLAAGLIHRVGKGFAGATMFGIAPDVEFDVGDVTRDRVGARLLQAVDRPAGKGTFPGLFDTLVVTATGVDSGSGHVIAKVQRGDGITWVVDLEAVRVEGSAA